MRLLVLSVTVPLMDPPTTCAHTAAAASGKSSKKTARKARGNKVRTKEVKVVSCRLAARYLPDTVASAKFEIKEIREVKISEVSGERNRSHPSASHQRQQHTQAAQQAVRREVVMEGMIIVERVPCSIRSGRKRKPTRRLMGFKRRLRGFQEVPGANFRRISGTLQKVHLSAQQPWCRNKGDRQVQQQRGW
jgi:hypothetical protein